MLESAPETCTWKVYFYMHACTLAASESGFHHANRILRLKVEVLVYTVSRLGYQNVKTSHRSLTVDSRVALLFRHSFPSLDTQDIERGQLRCTRSSVRFLTAHICAGDEVWNFLSASDRNHANTPDMIIYEYTYWRQRGAVNNYRNPQPLY